MFVTQRKIEYDRVRTESSEYLQVMEDLKFYDVCLEIISTYVRRIGVVLVKIQE